MPPPLSASFRMAVPLGATDTLNHMAFMDMLNPLGAMDTPNHMSAMVMVNHIAVTDTVHTAADSMAMLLGAASMAMLLWNKWALKEAL